MKKRLLQIFSLCLPLAVLLAMLTAGAAGDDIVASGDCGYNVKWSLDSKGTLTIAGTGDMFDYVASWSPDRWTYTTAPWISSDNANMITSLTVGEGVTGIGVYAFSCLERLTKVSLPDSLIRIKDGAFGYCNSLTKITFPDSVASIEDNVFRGCSNLVSFTIPENVTSIGARAFQDCDRLTKMVIPKNTENISVEAFLSCDRLKSVTILGDCSTIKANTFKDCHALAEVTIPDSVIIVEESAFSGCSALKDVYYVGTEDMWGEVSIDNEHEPLEDGNDPLINATIHADTSPESAYRINGITVSDNDGKPLSAIPKGAFLATVSITNRVSGTSPVVFLAAYSSGKFQDFAYVTLKEPVGATMEVTLPISNSAGNITELKAFAVSSIGGYAPIGNPVSYP